MATIQEVYIALFGRPADPIGYQYYVDATNNGEDLGAVGDLTSSPEYLERFEDMTNAQMVNQIYQDLFGRDADVEGLTHYVGLLNSGAASVQDIAIRIIDGATGTDAEIIANKVAAAQAFTESLDTGEEILAYQGDAAAEAGRTFLSGVTEDDTTIPDQEAVDAAIEDLPGNIGDTFTLTTDVDAFVGTNANDTFQAILDGSGTDTTINTFDDIDGAGGRDTLNIVGTGAAAAIPDGANFSNIEVVNIAAATAVTNLNSASFEGVEEIWQVGAAGNVTVEEGVVAGFRDTNANIRNVTAAAGATSVAVAVDNAASEINFWILGDAVTTLTVSGSIAQASDPSVVEELWLDDHTGEKIETLNLSLADRTEVSLLYSEFTGLTTVDATGSAGGIVIDLSAATYANLESATFGAGADGVTAAISDETDTAFVLGAGNDALTLDGTGDTENSLTTISLGEGNDSLVLTTNLTNIRDASEAEFESGLITVSDFDAGEDVFDISALNLTLAVLDNVELADIRDAGSLFEAIGLAADSIDTTASENAALFTYDGDAYLLASTDTDFNTGDGLVQLVGITASDLDAASFVIA